MQIIPLLNVLNGEEQVANNSIKIPKKIYDSFSHFYELKCFHIQIMQTETQRKPHLTFLYCVCAGA